MRKILWVAADTETDNHPAFRSNATIDLEASRIDTVIIGYTIDGKNVKHFRTIEKFMNAIVDEDTRVSEARIFFHNLKFDFTQIVKQWFPWHVSDITDIKSVISSNRYYKIEFVYRDMKFIFMDTAKIYPMSLEDIATSLGLEKTKEWEYSLHRGFDDITKKEMHYFDTDIIIVFELLKRTYNIGKGANASNTKLHLTRGSMVLSELKEVRYSRIPGVKSERKDDRPNFLKYPDLYVNMNIYDLVKFRRGYYGGYVNVQPGLEGKLLKQGISLDYNSMYPSQMERPMPDWRTMKHYHEPSNYGLDERFKLFRIIIKQLVLKKNKVPVMPKKSLFGISQNIMTIRDLRDKEQFFTNWDMDFIEKNYNIEYDIVEVYEFEYKRNIFAPYIEKWRKKKVEAKTPFDRNNAKLFLNNGYGKMAQDTLLSGMQQLTPAGTLETEPALMYLDNDGEFRYTETNLPVTTIEVPNILIAMAITTYARHELFKAIDAVKQSKNYTYYYSDTDSVHIGVSKETMLKMSESTKDFANEALAIGNDLGIAYDENEFLHWKIESFFTEAKYLRSKTYAELNSVTGKDEIRVAGVRKKGQLKFFKDYGIKNFKLGIEMETLQSAQVKNGTMLYTVHKKIG